MQIEELFNSTKKISVNVTQHDIDRSFLLEPFKSPLAYALERFFHRTCKLDTSQIILIQHELRTVSQLSFIVQKDGQEYYGNLYVDVGGAHFMFYVRTHQFDKVNPGVFALAMQVIKGSVRSDIDE